MTVCDENNPSCARNLGPQAGRFCAVCGQSNPNRIEGTAPPSVVITAQQSQSKQTLNWAHLRANLLETLRRDNSPVVRVTPEMISQAVGGLLCAIGAIAFIVDTLVNSGSPKPSVAGLLCLAIAIGLAYASFKRPDLQLACTAAAVALVPFGTILVFNSLASDGKPGTVLILAGVIILGLWFAPGLCGRQSLLSGALLSFSFGLVLLSAQTYFTDLARYDDSVDYTSGDVWLETARKATALAIIAGIALLLFGLRLHLRGWSRVATIFIAVGILDATVGVFGYVQARQFDDISSALFVAAFAVVLIAVAAGTGRKATSWFSVVVTLIAITGLVTAMLGSESSGVVGVVLAAVGSAVAIFVSPRIGQPLSKLPFLQSQNDQAA